MPRNIDPEINKIPNVYLFDIDDIGKMIENNIEIRKREADAAIDLINASVAEFMNWKESLNTVPVIISLRNKIKNLLESELSRYITDEKEKDIVVNSLTNKLLHEPTMLIKKSSLNPDGINSIKTVKALFNLDSEDYSEVSKKHISESVSETAAESEYSETKIKLVK
jgi:glutamyl-tRNA reductase